MALENSRNANQDTTKQPKVDLYREAREPLSFLNPNELNTKQPGKREGEDLKRDSRPPKKAKTDHTQIYEKNAQKLLRRIREGNNSAITSPELIHPDSPSNTPKLIHPDSTPNKNEAITVVYLSAKERDTLKKALDELTQQKKTVEGNAYPIVEINSKATGKNEFLMVKDIENGYLITEGNRKIKIENQSHHSEKTHETEHQHYKHTELSKKDLNLINVSGEGNSCLLRAMAAAQYEKKPDTPSFMKLSAKEEESIENIRRVLDAEDKAETGSMISLTTDDDEKLVMAIEGENVELISDAALRGFQMLQIDGIIPKGSGLSVYYTSGGKIEQMLLLKKEDKNASMTRVYIDPSRYHYQAIPKNDKLNHEEETAYKTETTSLSW